MIEFRTPPPTPESPDAPEPEPGGTRSDAGGAPGGPDEAGRPKPDPGALEALGDEIARLSAHIEAATHRLLVLLARFDRAGGWAAGWGFRSCAHWYAWRTDTTLGTAREKLRVARALEALPVLGAAMSRGELSYSKARALTRVATPENEAELLEFARHGTAAHVERLVRAWRTVDRLESPEAERRRHEARHLTVRPAVDGGYLVRGKLEAEVGAVLLRALEAAGAALHRNDAREESDDVPRPTPESTPKPTAGQRRADALGLLAEWALAAGLDGGDAASEPLPLSGLRAGRFEVVVHVEGGAMEEGAVLDDGTRLSAETSRRLSCDAARVAMAHGPDGSVLDVGRRTRTVPPALRRALDARDGGCRFPGCGLRFTDAHHIVHWAEGGETTLSNLLLLCRRHHRAVHEDGVRIDGVPGPAGCPTAEDGEEDLRFHRADGRPIPEVPDRPTVPAEPARALAAENRRRGIEIDRFTATPRWLGEPLDLDHAIATLRRPASLRKPTSPPRPGAIRRPGSRPRDALQLRGSSPLRGSLAPGSSGAERGPRENIGER